MEGSVLSSAESGVCDFRQVVQDYVQKRQQATLTVHNFRIQSPLTVQVEGCMS